MNLRFIPDMILKRGDMASPRFVTFHQPCFNLTHHNNESPSGDFCPRGSGWRFAISSCIRWNNVGWGCLTLVFIVSDLPQVLTEGDI
jgi:hypothetical protein